MKILYVASEAEPYAASGGLGDVMGALPKEIAEIEEGNDVSVILPFYNTVSENLRCEFEKVCDITFSLSWRKTGASIYRHKRNNVNYYFVENHYYFDRNRSYGEYDDGERFAFFSKATLEFILARDMSPDIIHANDWQTALTVIYLKTEYRSCEKLKNIKTVFTVHNIEYQGKYGWGLLGDVFGIDAKFSNVLSHNGCINLLKGGILLSDCVTTVSPNYKNELSHEFFAFGLADVIRSFSHKMSGIINGIDYSVFSPDKNGDIYFPYDKAHVKSGKEKNKRALQNELGLVADDKIPILIMVTRLTEGKGIDLFLHIADELLEEDVQIIVLGSGEEKYEKALLALDGKYENFKAFTSFDRALSKKLYAGADIFLMPSKSEPCGLAQMIACSYGTVPVVRSVGGLYDTIIPYGEDNANGFRFDNYNAHEFLFCIKDALEVYKVKIKWSALRRKTINSDFSWHKSALEYMAVYKKLIV